MNEHKVEKIYSRYGEFRLTKRKRKVILVIIILITSILTVKQFFKGITPIVDAKCKEIAISVAGNVSNKEISRIAKKYNYSDLSNIEMDGEKNIKLIKINTGLVNNIMSDAAIGIQKELNNYDEGNFNIRLGSFLGIKILAGRGPKVKIKMQTAGNVNTELKSEFINKGINQTLHRMYIEVKCSTIVYTPYHNTKEEVKNKILLAEAVIVGNIPDTYYNLVGIDQDTALQVLN